MLVSVLGGSLGVPCLLSETWNSSYCRRYDFGFVPHLVGCSADLSLYWDHMGLACGGKAQRKSVIRHPLRWLFLLGWLRAFSKTSFARTNTRRTMKEWTKKERSDLARHVYVISTTGCTQCPTSAKPSSELSNCFTHSFEYPSRTSLRAVGIVAHDFPHNFRFILIINAYTTIYSTRVHSLTILLEIAHILPFLLIIASTYYHVISNNLSVWLGISRMFIPNSCTQVN